MLRLCLALLWLGGSLAAQPQGAQLEGYHYPFPVSYHQLEGLGEPLQMAVMVVEPAGSPNGRTVVLLHGKNFNGAYWESTAKVLSERGFRVVIPDQIGFGKSSKPTEYGYTFAQLVNNTRSVLQAQGVGERVTVLGHSMGGMLAVHWGLLHPEEIDELLLLNPIGLEDWLAKGVPYRGLPAWYQKELSTTPESIREYQKRFYYDGKWTPEFAKWADLLAAPIGSPEYPQVAKVQALTTAMVMSQPVVGKLHTLEVPTTLILGERDRTALDRDLAAPEVAETLGRYDLLGSETVQRLRKGRLIPLEGLGHLPHIEDFARFQAALWDALGLE